jgi:hypothetical protein
MKGEKDCEFLSSGRPHRRRPAAVCGEKLKCKILMWNKTTER